MQRIAYFDREPVGMDVAFEYKSNVKSVYLRQAGNRLFSAGRFQSALEEFNKSICWAETGSEDLAIAYANRSAVFHKMGEYEVALANIDLAKKHNYPQRLMPKLLAREYDCNDKIDSGFSAKTNSSTALIMHVETNPKIPFLAKGIKTGRLPNYRRCMTAKQDFKVGDVLLHEKAIVTTLTQERRYLNCNHCGSENFHSLIPCPKCISAMYCGQKCLENDQKSIHRFECGFIPNELCGVIGPRMFFYGLTLFDDNLQMMLDFANSHSNATVTGKGDDPLRLDFTNYNALEGFKLIHNVDTSNDEYSSPFDTAAFRLCMNGCYVLYLSHPNVKAIFNTPALREIMLKCFEKYQRIAIYLTFLIPSQVEDAEIFCHFFPIASICNHSCNPNTAALYSSGELKFVARRPIAKDEQILISYGFGLDPALFEFVPNFRCFCTACTRLDLVREPKRPIPEWNKHKLCTILSSDRANLAARVNALEQFIQLYSRVHSDKSFIHLQNIYHVLLSEMFINDQLNEFRAKAADAAGRQSNLE